MLLLGRIHISSLGRSIRRLYHLPVAARVPAVLRWKRTAGSLPHFGSWFSPLRLWRAGDFMQSLVRQYRELTGRRNAVTHDGWQKETVSLHVILVPETIDP